MRVHGPTTRHAADACARTHSIAAAAAAAAARLTRLTVEHQQALLELHVVAASSKQRDLVARRVAT
jgi:hypothetical protein